MDRVGLDPRSFPPGMSGHPSLYQGVRGSVWGSGWSADHQARTLGSDMALECPVAGLIVETATVLMDDGARPCFPGCQPIKVGALGRVPRTPARQCHCSC
jgi:hypothetical protein